MSKSAVNSLELWTPRRAPIQCLNRPPVCCTLSAFHFPHSPIAVTGSQPRWSRRYTPERCSTVVKLDNCWCHPNTGRRCHALLYHIHHNSVDAQTIQHLPTQHTPLSTASCIISLLALHTLHTSHHHPPPLVHSCMFLGQTLFGRQIRRVLSEHIQYEHDYLQIHSSEFSAIRVVDQPARPG